MANTFVTKALQRVLAREKKSLPLDQRLEDVVESSNGDLRCAINSLQWLCVKSKRQMLKFYLNFMCIYLKIPSQVPALSCHRREALRRGNWYLTVIRLQPQLTPVMGRWTSCMP